jgi:RNA polymerase sigma-70 factor (ECF subfamily)
MITNREDVEDLTQEAFIKAFNSLDKFDSQFAFSTWLYKIATNNCIDYIRKRKLNTYSIDKDISTDDDDMKFEIPDSNYLPDKDIIDDERKKILAGAIDKLPLRYKKVILMRHKDDMEYEEIAKKLKLPIGTVKAHIFRGRELLNKYLKDKLGNF